MARIENKGKMRLDWYWLIYGHEDEVVFTYSRSRGHKQLLDTLGDINGTLLSDGHSAYRRYAEKVLAVVHTHSWTQYPDLGLIRSDRVSSQYS